MSYPLFKVHIDKNSVMSNIEQVLDSGYINEGEQVTKLTTAFENILETRNLVLVNSCTSAIQLALRLSNVGYADDVVSTPMTCIATNCPIVTSGADIVWADIDPTTGCIDPDDVDRIIDDLELTPKAIIAVAWAGNPPKLKELKRIAERNNSKLILDAAHGFGTIYDGSQIHDIPDFTCYSLQAIKHITSGDGGILVCNSSTDYKLAKMLKWFGIDRDDAKDAKGNWKGQHWNFDVPDAGYKFNMNNITAAIGLSQIQHVDRIVSAHKSNAKIYDSLFANNVHFSPIKSPNNSESSHWVYTIVLDEKFSSKRDSILRKLNADGIQAGLVHVPNNDYTCFAAYTRQLDGVKKFSETQLSLPVGWWLNDDDVTFIGKKLIELCDEECK